MHKSLLNFVVCEVDKLSLDISRSRFNDRSKIKVGSVIACDLAYGIIDHSGIYVGNNEVIELNGNGLIRKISIEEFIRDGKIRTGENIHTATWKNESISCAQWAYNAEKLLNEPVNYHLALCNCHNFIFTCISEGELFSPKPFKFEVQYQKLSTNIWNDIGANILMNISNNLSRYSVESLWFWNEKKPIATFEQLSKRIFLIHFLISQNSEKLQTFGKDLSVEQRIKEHAKHFKWNIVHLDDNG